MERKKEKKAYKIYDSGLRGGGWSRQILSGRKYNNHLALYRYNNINIIYSFCLFYSTAEIQEMNGYKTKCVCFSH